MTWQGARCCSTGRHLGEGARALYASRCRRLCSSCILVATSSLRTAIALLLFPIPRLRANTECIVQLSGGATPTVSVVFDLAGEVAACVADVALLEQRLGPPLLQQPRVAAALAAAAVVMLDGNLAPAALKVRGGLLWREDTADFCGLRSELLLLQSSPACLTRHANLQPCNIGCVPPGGGCGRACLV